MTLGGNQIAAYAADLLDLEEQIGALQDGKRDLYKAIREEHGRLQADAIKNAVRIVRMDSEKRERVEETDAETARVLKIIEAGTVVATPAPARKPEPAAPQPEPTDVAADQGGEGGNALSADPNNGAMSAVTPENNMPAQRTRGPDHSAVDTHRRNSKGIRKPDVCLHVEVCHAMGWRQPCNECQLAHADANGFSA